MPFYQLKLYYKIVKVYLNTETCHTKININENVSLLVFVLLPTFYFVYRYFIT